MELLADDPTIAALRRALDRYATAPETGEDLTGGLVSVIFGCLPLDICNTVFAPADGTEAHISPSRSNPRSGVTLHSPQSIG